MFATLITKNLYLMKNNLWLSLLLCGSMFVHGQEITKTAFGQKIQAQGINHVVSGSSIPLDETENDTLWHQDRSYADNEYSITSSHFDGAGWGMYSADDFEVTDETTINSIFFHGSQSAEDGADYINGIAIYIFEDNDGKPAGNPDNEESIFAKAIDIDIDDVDVEPGEDAFLGHKEYFIDLKSLGKSIELPTGTYWISIVFDLDLDENDFDIRWLWNDSQNDHLNIPMVIEPSDESGLGITQWTTIEEVGFPIQALAFTLFGEGDEMGTPNFDTTRVRLYPNPATDSFSISTKSTTQIEQVEAVDMLGKKHTLPYHDGSVDISQLATGTYIVHIKTNQGTFSKRMIKN